MKSLRILKSFSVALCLILLFTSCSKKSTPAPTFTKQQRLTGAIAWILSGVRSKDKTTDANWTVQSADYGSGSILPFSTAVFSTNGTVKVTASDTDEGTWKLSSDQTTLAMYQEAYDKTFTYLISFSADGTTMVLNTTVPTDYVQNNGAVKTFAVLELTYTAF